MGVGSIGAGRSASSLKVNDGKSEDLKSIKGDLREVANLFGLADKDGLSSALKNVSSAKGGVEVAKVMDRRISGSLEKLKAGLIKINNDTSKLSNSLAQVNRAGGKFVRMNSKGALVAFEPGIRHEIKKLVGPNYSKNVKYVSDEYGSNVSDKIKDALNKKIEASGRELDEAEKKLGDHEKLADRLANLISSLDKMVATEKADGLEKIKVQREALPDICGKKNRVKLAPEDKRAFANIYSCSDASVKINEMLRHRSDQKISGTEIAQTLEDRHGDQIFAKGGKSLKTEIKSLCDRLDYNFLNEYCKEQYDEGVGRGALKAAGEVVFRGQGMTEKGLNELRKMVLGGATTISPTSLLSCAIKESVAKEFASDTRDPIRLMMHITGKTQFGMGSANSVNNENEVVFTPLSQFRMDKLLKKENGGYELHLTELMPTEYKDKENKPMPY